MNSEKSPSGEELLYVINKTSEKVRNQTLSDVEKIIDEKIKQLEKDLPDVARRTVEEDVLLEELYELIEEIKNLKDNSQGTSNRYRDNDETCKVAKSSVNPDTRKGCGKKVNLFYGHAEYFVKCGNPNIVGDNNIILCEDCEVKE